MLMLRRQSQAPPMQRVRHLPNNERIVVSTDLQYKNYLIALKSEFEERLEEVPVASETGLRGFHVISVIGTGSFGEVSIVRDVEGNTFAVKAMEKQRILSRDKVIHILTEKRLLHAFRFPFLVWLIFVRKDREYLYLGMPLLSGGELFNLHAKYVHFSEDHARFYAAQVCLAFEYLHFMRVVYRDLKLENLVLDSRGYIRLTDFGLSKRVELRTMSLCGTPEYLSPETLTATPYFSGPDWWAFGVLVYEMIDGETPFTNYLMDTKMMYAAIIKADYKMPRKFSEPLKDLIRNILVVDITKRLGCRYDGADDIKRHEWFQTVNWFSYLRKEVEPPFVPQVRHALDTRYFVKPKKNKVDNKTPPSRYSYRTEFADF